MRLRFLQTLVLCAAACAPRDYRLEPPIDQFPKVCSPPKPTPPDPDKEAIRQFSNQRPIFINGAGI